MLISNIPASIKWRVYRGDTASFVLNVNDDNGEPEDVTGWVWTGQVRTDPDDETPTATLLIIPEVGAVSITLEADSFDDLGNTNYFDIQAVKPDETVWTAVKGTIIVGKDVTR